MPIHEHEGRRWAFRSSAVQQLQALADLGAVIPLPEDDEALVIVKTALDQLRRLDVQ